MSKKEKKIIEKEVGEFVKFKFPEALFDEQKLFKYSVEFNFLLDENSKPFDAKKINYQTIVEIDKHNKEYIKEFAFLFCKPTEKEVVDFLASMDRFEEIIKIKNGEEYSRLLTKEEQNKRVMQLYEKLKNIKKE